MSVQEIKAEEGIAEILARHPNAKRDALIPILQDVQESRGFVSREAVEKIGRHLRLPMSKVYGVATFYNQFRFQKPGRYHIQVCRGTACHVKGSLRVLQALQQELKVEPGNTTGDGLFSLEVVACVGACGLAPTMSINGEVYAGLTPAKARKIIAGYREGASHHG
jgi:NADH-quinone oxidoreductase subunit E